MTQKTHTLNTISPDLFFCQKILSIKIQLSGNNFLSHSDSAFGLRNQLFLRNVKLISNICSWHKSTIVLS